MEPKIVPTQKEIENVMNECSDLEAEGETKFRNMTYEQGVAETIRWMLGEIAENPLTE